MPAVGCFVFLEEFLVLLIQFLDDIRSDCMIEHHRSANLHSSTAEQEVAERLCHVGDSTDSGEALVWECLGERRHLREREWKNRRPAESATRYESVDVDFEVECIRIDQRK